MRLGRPRRRGTALAAAVLLAAALPALPSTAQAPDHAFLHEAAGRPARWDPCAPVPWTLSAQEAPPGGAAAVHAAVAEVRRRTGLDLRFAGTTREPPTSAALRPGTPRRLLVGWSRPGRSDLLRGRDGRTVGMARVRWSRGGGPLSPPRLDGAVVALNAEARAPATGPGSWYAYALHELAHAAGLGHVPEGTPGSLMTPVLDRGLSGYGPGDLAGLRRLGGCSWDRRRSR